MKSEKKIISSSNQATKNVAQMNIKMESTILKTTLNRLLFILGSILTANLSYQSMKQHNQTELGWEYLG